MLGLLIGSVQIIGSSKRRRRMDIVVVVVAFSEFLRSDGSGGLISSGAGRCHTRHIPNSIVMMSSRRKRRPLLYVGCQLVESSAAFCLR